MQAMQAIWGQDIDKYGSVLPFAVHLHMHDHGTRMWVDHLRLGQPNATQNATERAQR